MSGYRPVNVEGKLVAYLDGLLTEPVSTKVPNPRPAAFVRLNRVGGLEANMIQERPSLLIECYANTDLAAWQLAAKVWAALHGRDELTVGGVDLDRRELSLPVNYPDPATTQARYQFTAQVTVTLEKEPTP